MKRFNIVSVFRFLHQSYFLHNNMGELAPCNGESISKEKKRQHFMCRKATSKLVLFCQLLISLDISLWKGAQGHREREREVGRMEGEEEERREDKSSPVNKAA